MQDWPSFLSAQGLSKPTRTGFKASSLRRNRSGTQSLVSAGPGSHLVTGRNGTTLVQGKHIADSPYSTLTVLASVLATQVVSVT